jgi:hypothetical protein
MPVSIRTIVFVYIGCKVLFAARGVQLLAVTAKISESGSDLLEMKNSNIKITNLVKKKANSRVTNSSEVFWNAMPRSSVDRYQTIWHSHLKTRIGIYLYRITAALFDVTLGIPDGVK